MKHKWPQLPLPERPHVMLITCGSLFFLVFETHQFAIVAHKNFFRPASFPSSCLLFAFIGCWFICLLLSPFLGTNCFCWPTFTATFRVLFCVISLSSRSFYQLGRIISTLLLKEEKTEIIVTKIISMLILFFKKDFDQLSKEWTHDRGNFWFIFFCIYPFYAGIHV